MQFYELTEKKIRYLKKELQLPELSAADRFFAGLKDAYFVDKKRWSQEILTAFKINILFAVVKNRLWLRVPICRDLLLAFIQKDFQIDLETSEKISDGLVHILCSDADLLKVSNNRDDKDFLTYLCVTGLAVKTLEDLDLELGLGNSVASHLYKILDFDPELQDDQPYAKELNEVYSELQTHFKKRQWFLDALRLRFSLKCFKNPLFAEIVDSYFSEFYVFLSKLSAEKNIDFMALERLYRKELGPLLKKFPLKIFEKFLGEEDLVFLSDMRNGQTFYSMTNVLKQYFTTEIDNAPTV